MSDFRRYYWDSSVFCSFLSEEEGRFQIVQDLLDEAHAGRIEIITSSFSLVEVLNLKGNEKITEAQEVQLTTFFEYPFIKIVNATRDVCEFARNYVWRHGMAPKDAVHMASAEFAAKVAPIHSIFSWDSDFVNLNGKTGMKIQISHPFMHQGLLRLEDSTEAESGSPEPGEPSISN